MQIDGFGTPEGSLRRKQQIKIANSKTIRKTRPAILPLKKNETKSVIFLHSPPQRLSRGGAEIEVGRREALSPASKLSAYTRSMQHVS